METLVRQFNPDGTRSLKSSTIRFDDGYAEKPVSMEALDWHKSEIGKTAIQSALLASGDYNSFKIITMGWGGNIETEIARLELAEIQRQNPEEALLVINNPGSGESSPLPRGILSEMKKTGSFDPYGELVAEAVRQHLGSRLDDIDGGISSYGHSFGARTAISTATYLENVGYITATDPPGSRKLGVPGIGRGFLIKESSPAAEYAKHTDNKPSLRLQQENDALALQSIKAMGGRATWQQFVDQPQIIAKAGLANDIETLAKTGNVGMLQINSPEFSELNRPEDVGLILQKIAEKYPHIVLCQLLLYWQTHSVNVGGNSHTTGALSRPH